MKVNVHHNPDRPGYQLLPAGTCVADQMADASSGVQLMLPLALYAANIELGQIVAGRLHVTLRDTLLRHGRAFVADDVYGLHRRVQVDLYRSRRSYQLWLAVLAGRSFTPLIEDVRTGVVTMGPLKSVARGVLLAEPVLPPLSRSKSDCLHSRQIGLSDNCLASVLKHEQRQVRR
ncbi:MAG: hypothetical protein EOO81_10985 [Oxalobacteraceae bacterium]|nr:MAG: hypothetical protein EOO81_10985 [Oxalobacteraceae bacterium]